MRKTAKRQSYEQTIRAEQRAMDARRIEEMYTGAARDLVTGDYQVWVQGRLVGWAPTMAQAIAEATRQHADLLHLS